MKDARDIPEVMAAAKMLNAPKVAPKRCSDCKGRGRVVKDYGDRTGTIFEVIDCPACKGTGVKRMKKWTATHGFVNREIETKLDATSRDVAVEYVRQVTQKNVAMPNQMWVVRVSDPDTDEVVEHVVEAVQKVDLVVKD